MSVNSKSELSAMVPLFLLLFIDAVGLGIMFPILAPAILSPDGIFPASTPASVRNFFYGATLGVFPLVMFITCPLLGDLSDIIGRKKTLLICLVATVVEYSLIVVALLVKNIVLLLIGRMIGGIAAGSESIAQAAVMDISRPETKANNIGLLVIPISVGIAAGPLIGSLLSDKALFAGANIALPLEFCAVLSVVNFIILLTNFQETRSHIVQKAHMSLKRCLTIFSGFNQKNMLLLGAAYLFMQMAWSFYFNYISLYLTLYFNTAPVHIGYFFSLQGLGFAVGTGILVRWLLTFCSLITASIVVSIIASMAVLVTLITNNEALVWIVGIPMAMAFASGYSLQLSLFSELVGSARQGWIMGIAGAIGSISWGLTGFASGALADVFLTLPLHLVWASLLLVIISTWLYSRIHTPAILN